MRGSLALTVLLTAGLVTCARPGRESDATPAATPARGATISIYDDAYGAYAWAPNALALGQQAPDFQLPQVAGGSFDLGAATARGDVVIVFYRGFW